MTTAERREAILAQLGRKPIAARTLAAKYGVSVRSSCRIWRCCGPRTRM